LDTTNWTHRWNRPTTGPSLQITRSRLESTVSWESLASVCRIFRRRASVCSWATWLRLRCYRSNHRLRRSCINSLKPWLWKPVCCLERSW